MSVKVLIWYMLRVYIYIYICHFTWYVTLSSRRPRFLSDIYSSLPWRHNELAGVSNHQPTIVYSTVYSHADQRKHQSSASLAIVWGIHRWIPRAKGQWRGKCFHLMTSSWLLLSINWNSECTALQDQPPKSNNAPVPFPTMHHSKQKCNGT